MLNLQTQSATASKTGLIFVLILSALMAVTSLSTDIYLPAMPVMAKDLQGDAELTITGFLIGFCIAQLIWGPISDHFGRRQPLFIGLGLFVIGSVGCVKWNTEFGHQPVALVRNRRKVKLFPRGTDVFYGDVSMPETLTDLPKDIDAVIFTLGSDGQGRIGARVIDYGGVRNVLKMFKDKPIRIALMTTIGVTERLSTWNQRTEVHDWKRRAERLVRASGHPYTIVRPGWFDYNNDDEHKIVMLQGDRRHTGTPEDGVVSREQIAQVLVSALSNDAAKNKTFELVAVRGKAQQDLTPLFADLRTDNPQKNDGVLDMDNMPLSEEPECIINELNLYSKPI